MTHLQDRKSPALIGDRGFTLIELLVVIGIIGVLIAIALPALRGANQAAKRTKALANVRSTGQQFEDSAAREGHYPFQAPGTRPAGMPDDRPMPGDLFMVRWWPGTAVIATTNHFEHEVFWPSVLVPEIEDWPQYYETWISPGMPTELPDQDEMFGNDGEEFDARSLISVRYSNSFVARPETWNAQEQGTIDRLQSLRPTRPHEVSFPSDKVMLWDGHLAYLTSPWPEEREGHLDAETPMYFADGHGASHNPLEASEPIDNPLNDDWNEKRLSDTLDGIHGRDY